MQAAIAAAITAAIRGQEEERSTLKDEIAALCADATAAQLPQLELLLLVGESLQQSLQLL